LSALLNAITFPLLPIFAAILYFNGRAREEKQFSTEPTNEDNNDKIRIEDLYAQPREEEDK
jgi:hypothetical protein